MQSPKEPQRSRVKFVRCKILEQPIARNKERFTQSGWKRMRKPREEATCCILLSKIADLTCLVCEAITINILALPPECSLVFMMNLLICNCNTTLHIKIYRCTKKQQDIMTGAKRSTLKKLPLQYIDTCAVERQSVRFPWN